MLLRVNYPKSVTTHKVAADRYSAFVANMTEDPTVKSADKQDRETEDDYEDSPLQDRDSMKPEPLQVRATRDGLVEYHSIGLVQTQCSI